MITEPYVWRDSFIRVTWHIHMCDVTHAYVWHVFGSTRKWYVRHQVYSCDTTHAYVCICVPWLIHVCDVTHSYVRHVLRHYSKVTCATPGMFVWHNARICMYMCAVTHSCVWRDSFICATYVAAPFESDMCDITYICATQGTHMYIYVWRDSFICVTWLIHMCHMTHSYAWHDSFICVTWLIHIW